MTNTFISFSIFPFTKFNAAANTLDTRADARHKTRWIHGWYCCSVHAFGSRKLFGIRCTRKPHSLHRGSPEERTRYLPEQNDNTCSCFFFCRLTSLPGGR